MATFHRYHCNNCGFEIECSESTNYFLMSGEFMQCLCTQCHKISNVRRSWLAKAPLEKMQCQHCGEIGAFTYWNPVNYGCPNCGKPLEEVKGFRIMFD